MRIRLSVHFLRVSYQNMALNDNTFINLLWLGPCKRVCIKSIRYLLLFADILHDSRNIIPETPGWETEPCFFLPSIN